MRWMRAVAGALAVIAASTAGAQESGIAVGSTAPGADIQTLDGKAINLEQYFGDGPVLVEFWATWCPNCKALEPKLNAAVAKYAGKLKVVAVAVSVNQSVERIKAYRERYGIKHDIVYDHKGWAADAYEVPATSYIVVIDANRKVVYSGVGANQDIEAAIAKGIR